MTRLARRQALALLGVALSAGSVTAQTTELQMPNQSESGVEQAFSTFVDAMQAGDPDALRNLIGDGFTLTHITDYVQPGDEWLAEMRQGKFVYHRITVQDIRVAVTGDTARLVARTLTDARVYGGRNEWRLQLALDYAWRSDRWIAERAVASIWN